MLGGFSRTRGRALLSWADAQVCACMCVCVCCALIILTASCALIINSLSTILQRANPSPPDREPALYALLVGLYVAVMLLAQVNVLLTKCFSIFWRGIFPFTIET